MYKGKMTNMIYNKRQPLVQASDFGRAKTELLVSQSMNSLLIWDTCVSVQNKKKTIKIRLGFTYQIDIHENTSIKNTDR